MALYLRTLRRSSRNVRLYLLTTTLQGFTMYGGINAVALNLFILRLGYGPEYVGILNGTSWLALALFSFPAGQLGRRIGSRRPMIFGQALTVGFLILLPLAEFMPLGWRLPWLITTNAMLSVGIAFVWVNSFPFLMGSTTVAERSHSFSAQFALSTLAAFAGAIVGGLLPGLWSRLLGVPLTRAIPYAFTLLVSGAMLAPSLAALIATREIGDGHRQEERRLEGKAPLSLMGAMAAVALLASAGQWLGQTFFNVYMDDALGMPTSLIGTILAAGQLLAAPASLLAPLALSRLGAGRTTSLAQIATSLSLLPLIIAPGWASAGLGAVGLLATVALLNPVIGQYQQSLVAPSRRTQMSGIITTAVSVGAAGSALAGGYIIAGLGYRSLFLLAAALMAGGALLFWAWARHQGGKPGEPTQPSRQ